jgi:hypothetical protein
MIYGFFGDIGSGKTLSMTRYGYYYHLAGCDVYSNYGLSFDHTKIDMDFMLSIVEEDKDFGENTVFLMDEFDMWADSRSSMKKTNKIISYFVKQVRKKNIRLLYATQQKHLIDKRIRGLTRKDIICTSKEVNIYDYTISVIYNTIISNKNDRRVEICKTRFYGNSFYDLYDTNELITAEESLND